jgi:hypothetical protein
MPESTLEGVEFQQINQYKVVCSVLNDGTRQDATRCDAIRCCLEFHTLKLLIYFRFT